MSIIAAAIKGGVLSIGSDSLTKYGTTKEYNDLIEADGKIVRAGDSYIASTGHVSTDLILRRFFGDSDNGLYTKEAIFETVLKLHSFMKEECFLNMDEDSNYPFESMGMELLIANSSGLYGVYEQRSIHRYRKFYAFGSGDGYALGAMHSIYPQCSSSKEIVQAGIEAAMAFDDGCGPPSHIYSVNLQKP